MIGRDQEDVGRVAIGVGAHARGVGAHRLEPPPHCAGHTTQRGIPGILNREAPGALLGRQQQPQAVAGAGGDDDVARINTYGPRQTHVLGDEGAQLLRARGRMGDGMGGGRPPGAAPQSRRQRAVGRCTRSQIASDGSGALPGTRSRGRRGGHLERGIHAGAAGARHEKALAGELLVGGDDTAPRYPQLTRQNACGGQRITRSETGIGDAVADVLNDLGGNGAVVVDLHVRRLRGRAVRAGERWSKGMVRNRTSE